MEMVEGSNSRGALKAHGRALLLLLLGLLLAGCVRHQVKEEVIDPGPPVRARAVPAGERLTVGIGRFSNETNYGERLFRDKYGDRIGKQASDALARRLMQTNVFNVVERPDLDRLEDEVALKGVDAKKFRAGLVGVDALILGSVVELGRVTTGEGWVIAKSKTQRVRARVVLRFVVPSTGVVCGTAEGAGEASTVSSSALGFGGRAGFDSTLSGKAIDAAVVNMMNTLPERLRACVQ
jgi:curli biogenesis system outer membrane secretion channel CsgG